jgi:hypothetical protein
MSDPMRDVVEVPAFLTENVLSIARKYQVGQWILDIPDATSYDAFPKSCRWASVLLAQFRECFGWATVSDLNLIYDDGQGYNWPSGNDLLSDWLQAVSRPLVPCNGVDAGLDLTLHWTNPEGATGVSVIPRAGRLIVDRQSQPTVSCDVILYPNLFTNTIHLLRMRDGEYDAIPTPFQPAARLNREALRHSLRCWEKLAHGVISSWDSDLVQGVEQYGFTDNAVPYD